MARARYYCRDTVALSGYPYVPSDFSDPVAPAETAARTIPGMFEWGPLFSWSERRTVYRLRGTEIARLTEKVGGGWSAIVNQHRPGGDPIRCSRDCRSFETGKAGVEEWARRHAARLEREVDEIARGQHRLGAQPKSQPDRTL